MFYSFLFILMEGSAILNFKDYSVNFQLYSLNLQGQITISSDTSPLVGIKFLAIPFDFDFAFKMHIKGKSFKQSIN